MIDTDLSVSPIYTPPPPPALQPLQEPRVLKSIRSASKPGRPSRLVFGILADALGSHDVGGLRAGHAALPASLSRADQEAVAQALRTPGFKADPGETIPAGDHVLLVGLGKKEALTDATFRRVGAGLVRALDRMDIGQITLAIDVADEAETGHEHAARCIAEGMALANFRVDQFDGKATNRTPPRGPLLIAGIDAARARGIARGLQLADSTNYARRLAATPPNICTPAFVANEARKLARATGLKCKVIGYAEAQKLGMGGLVNVGKGSDAKPCMVILEHAPKRVSPKARGLTLALVGKTMTYDTGGYSLKINNGMKGMKYDKNGGMAVLGAMHAIASLRLPVRVVALLPAAENMVSADSYRPDDIITMHNGVTVEVTNTDAEGRLILADALSYCCRTYKPSAIVDLATLTGGVVVALGSWCAGLFCNDAALRAALEQAADRSGERVWPLPLWSEHRDFMRARHADLWNSGPKRDGHPIQGAAFLSFFVDEKIPWAHIDIAGTSAVESDTDLFVTGPTGYGVRLLAEWVESYT